VRVEVVFSPGARAVEAVTVELAPGAKVSDALMASQLTVRHGIDTSTLRFSVWGRRCTASHALREGDRVECCRPLAVDPKQARHLRSAAQPPKRKRPARAGR
jgi:putative ubiquitin-RnfH superfamily antitoxin RatB of RatAB toxin-antitoxin module